MQEFDRSFMCRKIRVEKLSINRWYYIKFHYSWFHDICHIFVNDISYHPLKSKLRFQFSFINTNIIWILTAMHMWKAGNTVSWKLPRWGKIMYIDLRVVLLARINQSILNNQQQEPINIFHWRWDMDTATVVFHISIWFYWFYRLWVIGRLCRSQCVNL